MFQISRSMYRRLAPLVAVGDCGAEALRKRQHVLDACEQVMVRMAEDRSHFAHPDRVLFAEIRNSFSIRDLGRVYSLIECYVRFTDAYLEALPPDVTPFGEPRRCQASTRKGTPCRREPLPGMDYCPSHKHLVEPEEWYPRAAARSREELVQAA